MERALMISKEVAKIYKHVLVNKANLYMSENEYVIFVTWVEETKGAFKVQGKNPRRLKKLGFEIRPDGLKERRMI